MKSLSQTLATPSGDRLPGWLIFPAILLIYLLFPTKNYYWDGIFFARVIEAAPGLHPSLLHPNHLLYNVFGYFLYKFTQVLGLGWKAVHLLQVVNSIVSVLTAFLLFRILRRTLESRYLSWTLTLLFASSSTWWKFSTDADAYIPSVFFLLLAFYFALPDNKPRPLVVALIFSLAVCFHQLAVLAYPVLALAVFWQSSSRAGKHRRLAVLQFCLVSFALVLTTYCYGFYLLTQSTSPIRFARWVASYSPDASFSFDLISNLGYTLRGNVRLFFNARPSSLRGLLRLPIVTLLVVFIALILIWIFTTLRGFKRRQPKLLPNFKELFSDRLIRLYLIWIGVYLVFLFFWLPQNTFYRLFYLPPIVLLIGELLATRGSRKPTYRFALFVAIMTLSNFLFFIYPNTHAEKYPPLSLALEMNKVWQPGTVVYYAAETSDNNLIAYFNPSVEWRPLREFGPMENELREIYQTGKVAWLEASAIDQLQTEPGGGDWMARHARTETLRERRVRGYNVKVIQVVP